MVSTRDIERALVACGASRTKADTIGRLLRDQGIIPTRNKDAGLIGVDPRTAAAIVIAYFGTARTVKAAIRLKKLSPLKAEGRGKTLLDALASAIGDPEGFFELRISRVRRRAKLFRSDGSAESFFNPAKSYPAGRIEVEGVIDAELLKKISALFSGQTASNDGEFEDEDDD